MKSFLQSFSPRKSVFTLAVLLSAAPFIAGCDLAQNQLKNDRAANLEFQDFREGLEDRFGDLEEFAKNSDTGGLPPLQPYVSKPTEALKPMPLVTVAVSQATSVRDLLFDLAFQAGYDLELDPRIKGGIIFTARDRPFDEVVERLADIAGLRYTLEDQRLRVEVDRPYNKTYKLDYLSYVRSNEGSIRSSVAVVSGEGADSGSAFETTTESEANFWGELETSLTQILGARKLALLTAADPEVQVEATNPDVAVIGNAQVNEAGNIQVSPPDINLNVQSLYDEEEESQLSEANVPTFTINKQAGLVNVYAPDSLQREVKTYLDLVRKQTTSQVLIEAKILEVSLLDEFDAGIDWSLLSVLSGEGVLEFNSASVSNPVSAFANTATGNSFALGFLGNDVNAMVSALNEFGTTRALASPRLTVINNQSAVLNVADNRVFFEIDIDVTTEEGVTQTDIDSNIRNIPEGILVSVQPAINLDERTVSLAVRPTITRVVREVPDPAVQFQTAQAGVSGIESLIPEVNVQEIDSVIKVRSGQPIVMGGLLQDVTRGTEGGVPVLSEVPVMGSLFKSHSDSIEKVELVILLKATIVDNHDNIHATDRDIYKKFSGDRRPFRL